MNKIYTILSLGSCNFWLCHAKNKQVTLVYMPTFSILNVIDPEQFMQDSLLLIEMFILVLIVCDMLFDQDR